MRVFFLSLLISVAGLPLFAQNARPATEAEKAFTQKLEQRMSQLLAATAKSLPGNWSIHFNADKNGSLVDKTRHNGRPHEFRCSLIMEYNATKEEQAAMDKELAQHFKSMSKQDRLFGSRQNDPTLRYSIEITAIVNPYAFSVVDVDQLAALGGTVTMPGAALTLLRTKSLGVSAPYYSLYIGDYKTTNTSGKKLLEENFTSTPDCCDAKTMIIEVHSSQAMANSFIGKLDIPALNRVIQDL